MLDNYSFTGFGVVQDSGSGTVNPFMFGGLTGFDSGVLTQRTFNAANEMLTIVPASGTPTTQIFDPNGNLRSLTIGAAITTNLSRIT